MKILQAVLPTTRSHALLSAGTLIDSFGFGLFVTAGAVFFTRTIGLSAGQVGFGMSLAGLAGFCAAIPSGHLADRFGPRLVSAGLALAQACVMGVYVFVHSFAAFLVVTVLFSCLERGGSTARQALVGRLYSDGARVSVQAYLRSVLNVGISAGTAVAGVVLQFDQAAFYVALILTNALSFAVLAACMFFLPPTPPASTAHRSVLQHAVLRDTRYLAVGVLNGALALHASVLMVGLPLWVTLHTDAPRSAIAGLFLTNTVLTVLLQVRASRNSDSVPSAARSLARSALASAAACLLFAPTSGLPVAGALVLLVLATVVLTVGELLHSAGGWGLSFGLAPDRGQGAYLGAFSLGYALRDGLGPIAVTSLAIGHGTVGWVVLAAVFLALGAAVMPVVRWALAGRSGDGNEESAASSATAGDRSGQQRPTVVHVRAPIAEPSVNH